MSSTADAELSAAELLEGGERPPFSAVSENRHGVTVKFSRLPNTRARWDVAVVLASAIVLPSAALVYGLRLSEPWQTAVFVTGIFAPVIPLAFSLAYRSLRHSVRMATVAEVELGPHRVRWKNPAGLRCGQWSVHDLIGVGFASDLHSWIVRVDLRDGSSQILRLPEHVEARWLADVLEAWRSERATEPDEEFAAAMETLKAGQKVREREPSG